MQLISEEGILLPPRKNIDHSSNICTLKTTHPSREKKRGYFISSFHCCAADQKDLTGGRARFYEIPGNLFIGMRDIKIDHLQPQSLLGVDS